MAVVVVVGKVSLGMPWFSLRIRSKEKVKEVEIESIREKLARAADTGYRMWHNA